MSKNLYNNPDLNKFVEKTEDQNFEKKSARIRPNSLAEVYSAFANSSVAGGLIVVGISNDKDIEGVNSLGQSGINDLVQAQRIHCQLAQVEYKHFSIISDKGKKDGLLLFFVKFSSDKVIKTSQGKAFERVGDSTCEMSVSKIKQMEFDKGETNFEKESVQGVEERDLNVNLTKDFIDKWIVRDGLKNRPSVEDLILMKYLGIKRNGTLMINHAGILLFHNEPHKYIPGAFIRFLKYEGDTIETGQRSNIIKDESFKGPITKQINDASRMIKSQIREFSFLDNRGKFKTVLEYPEFAWYEAIVNAVAHRAYSLKHGNTFIRMFNNRIEVESPGNLPGIVTVKNIYRQHFPRNPVLMQSLLILRYVKSASEGMDRIKEEMRLLGLSEPKLDDDRNVVSFSIVLLNNIKERQLREESEELQKINQNLFEKLIPTQKEIIKFIAQNIKVKTGEIVDSLKMPRSTVNMNLTILENKGYIERVGPVKGPKVRYILSSMMYIGDKEEKNYDSKSIQDKLL